MISDILVHMDYATQLQGFGIEPTDKRIIILSLFVKANKPLSASFLLLALERTPIHRATVFRTIALFEKKDVLKKVDFYEGEFRYELSQLPHHHHCICRTCGSTTCIDICLVENTAKQIKRKTGFQTVDHSFTFFGICKECIELV